MTPLLDIPDNTAEWPAWLERRLVAPDLGELVAELNAIREPGAAQRTSTLVQVLGEVQASVLTGGLSVLDESILRRVLREPHLLLELQELVLREGGDYWQSVPRSDVHQDQRNSVWQLIESQLAAPPMEPLPTAEVRTVTPSRQHGNSRRLFLAATVAALLLVGAGFIWFQPPAAPTWGFDRPGALSASLPPDKYLEHLADAAEEWFRKRPESAPDLERRLREFRHGCDTLIAAPHPQLAAADRDWLRERCQVWAGKIDRSLVDLTSGAKPMRDVRDDADATLKTLIEALRTRAKAAANNAA